MTITPWKTLALGACLVLATATASAQPDLQTTPIMAVGAQTQLEGTVSAVNAETRLMTVRTADGTFEVLNVPPEVRLLDRVRIGNQVSLTRTKTALIELQTGRDAGAMGAEGATEVQRQPGSNRPAGSITDTVVLRGQVTGVNPAAGTVTIQGPNATETFQVQDKGQLDRVKVGDGVVVTIRNTIAGEITVR